jgi:hypothetical protein
VLAPDAEAWPGGGDEDTMPRSSSRRDCATPRAKRRAAREDGPAARWCWAPPRRRWKPGTNARYRPLRAHRASPSARYPGARHAHGAHRGSARENTSNTGSPRSVIEAIPCAHGAWRSN